MSKHSIIFVHGYCSSPNFYWFLEMHKKLAELDIDHVIPQFPGSLKPNSKTWLQIIDEVILDTDKPLVLVGHSLGTRALLLYLEKYKVRADLVILIAAFNNKVDNATRRNGNYANFFTHTIDLKKVKRSCKNFVVMHSKDDSTLAYEQGQQIATDLNADLLTYNDKNHFCNAGDAQEIINILREYKVLN